MTIYGETKRTLKQIDHGGGERQLEAPKSIFTERGARQLQKVFHASIEFFIDKDQV